MAEPMVLITLAFAGTSAGLSTLLLLIYGRSYSKVRAPFTLGLIIFAGSFLAQSLLAFYAFFTMMEFIPAWLAPEMAGIMAAQTLGLGVMLYSATR